MQPPRRPGSSSMPPGRTGSLPGPRAGTPARRTVPKAARLLDGRVGSGLRQGCAAGGVKPGGRRVVARRDGNNTTPPPPSGFLCSKHCATNAGGRLRAGGCFYDVAGSNDGDARHRCTSISVSTQGGGLADTGGKEHILFEIKEELDAKCAWLAFFGDDYRSHESLIGQSLCWHANGEMKKLRPFVSRRSELDNADLLDEYRELDYLDSEEGGAVPMLASDGENEGEDGGSEASDDEPMPPSLDALQSAKCCMHELGYSGCKRGGNKGQKKYFLDRRAANLAAKSGPWICHGCLKKHKECSAAATSGLVVQSVRSPVILHRYSCCCMPY